MNAKDRQGVQCDFCHRAVDPIYNEGTSPSEDEAVLDSLSTGPPLACANGQFVVDPSPIRRGPYDDAIARMFVVATVQRMDSTPSTFSRMDGMASASRACRGR